jgi:hypothetical protein
MFRRRICNIATIGIPIVLFILGLRSFITIINVVGGVFISLEAILTIVIYWRARRKIRTVPQGFGFHHMWLVMIPVLVVFAFMGVWSIIGLYKTPLTGAGAGTPVSFASVGSQPDSVILDSSGNAYVTNNSSKNLSKVTSGGTATTPWVDMTTVGMSLGLADITRDSSDNLFVLGHDSTASLIAKVTPAGVATVFASNATMGVSSHSHAITIDTSDNIYVANYNDNSVSRITPGGSYIKIPTTGGTQPREIITDGSGSIYTANWATANVSKMTPIQATTVTIAGQPATVVCTPSAGNLPPVTCTATVTVIPAMAEGVATFTITAKSVDGTTTVTSTTDSSIVTIDRTAPTISLTSLGGDTTAPYVTNDTTPDVVFTTTAGDTVTIAGYTCTPTPATGASVTCTKDAPAYASGTQSITPTIVDAAGNSTTGSAISFDVVTTTPTPTTTPDLQSVSDLGTSSTDNITSDNTPTFDIVCSAVGSVVKIYSNQPAANTLVATHTCTTAGTEAVTVSTLSDATHSITYTETASPATESLHSPALSVTVDTTAPTAPTTAPDLQTGSDTGSSSTDNITSDNTPTLDVTCSAIGNIITLSTGTTHTCTTVGTASVTLSPALADGTVSITYTEKDVAGNTSAASPALSVTVDTSAPAAPTLVSVGSDTTAPYITNDNTPNIVFTVESGVTVTATGFTCTTVATTATCTRTTAYTDGAQSMTPTITDAAGNSTVGTPVSFTIDTIPPTTPTITTPSSVITTGTHTLSGICDTTVSTVTITGTGFTPSPTTTTCSGGTYSTTLTVTAGGTITTSQTDAAGNTSSTTLPYTLTSSGGGGGSYSSGIATGNTTSSVTAINSSTTISAKPAATTPAEVKALAKPQCFINYTRLIKRGMRGNDVKQAQVCMTSLGHDSGPFDGLYGKLTYAGIISYQTTNKLLIDGIIGPETAGHLNALSGVKLDGVTPLK